MLYRAPGEDHYGHQELDQRAGAIPAVSVVAYRDVCYRLCSSGLCVVVTRTFGPVETRFGPGETECSGNVPRASRKSLGDKRGKCDVSKGTLGTRSTFERFAADKH